MGELFLPEIYPGKYREFTRNYSKSPNKCPKLGIYGNLLFIISTDFSTAFMIFASRLVMNKLSVLPILYFS